MLSCIICYFDKELFNAFIVSVHSRGLYSPSEGPGGNKRKYQLRNRHAERLRQVKATPLAVPCYK